jgi:hypothetical protein
MVSIILLILLILSSILLILAVILIGAPIKICYEKNNEQTSINCLKVTFLHSGVLYGVYDFLTKQISCVLCGRHIIKPIQPDEENLSTESVEKPVSPVPSVQSPLVETIEKEASFSDTSVSKVTVAKEEVVLPKRPVQIRQEKSAISFEEQKPEFSGPVGGKGGFAEEAVKDSPTGRKSFKNTLKEIKRYSEFLIQHKAVLVSLVLLAGRFLRACLRVVQFEKLSCGIRMGSRNPANTGVLCGMAAALIAMIDNGPRIRVWFEPVFNTEDSASVTGQISCKTSIAGMIFPIVVVLLFFPYFPVLKVYRQYRRLRKTTIG